MRLYKTVGLSEQDTGDASSWITKWDGTQADAAARRKEFKANELGKIKTEEVDVPTSKQELLAWLNAHAVGE